MADFDARNGWEPACIMDDMPVSEPYTAPRDTREVHLDNGLKIVVKSVRTAPLVSVWC